MEHLAPGLLSEVLRAAITLGLDRRVLLASLPPAFAASLPLARTPADQLHSDLSRLNSTPRLMDGSLPLEAWLQAARSLGGLRRESIVFDAALRAMADSVDSSSGGARPWSVPESPVAAGAPLLYIVASDEDGHLLARLRTHFSALQKTGRIRLFTHADIPPGGLVGDWRKRMKEASIVLVLASAYLFASQRASEELDLAVERHGRGEIELIPVRARPVDLEISSLRAFIPLPRNGTALSTSSDVDQALVEIASAVRTALEARAGAGQAQEHRGPDLAAESGGVDPGTPLADIFRTAGPPEHTFVDPREMPSLIAALASMGKGLFVEGPSQIGKSTAVRRALRGQKSRMYLCRVASDVDDLRRMAVDGRLDGHVIVDDAHVLDGALLGHLCTLAWRTAESERPSAKMTFLGPPGLAKGALPDYHMRARFDVIPIGRQPEELVLQLVKKGERAARIQITHRAEVARQSVGSFRIAQEICQKLTTAAGLSAVPERPRTIERHPNEVEPEVMASLPFREVLQDLIEATERASVATLAALWVLGSSGQQRTTLLDVERQFPHLESCLRDLGSGKLSVAVQRSPALQELFEVGRGSLQANDPRLSYFLSRLDWIPFAEEASIDARLGDDGRLIVPPPRLPCGAADAAGAAGPTFPSSWMDLPIYPFHLPAAASLLKLLQDAYPSVAATQSLAAQVPIRLGAWENNRGFGPAWESMLKLAAAQSKMRALVSAVLADENVCAFHEQISSLVEQEA